MPDRRSIFALFSSLAILAGPASAEPVVPGFVVEVYASVDLPMRLSFDEVGALFVGNNNPYPDPAPIVRVGPGGAPVDPYGPPQLDPDAVIVYDSGSLVPATDGSVFVGGVWDAGNGYVTEILPDETGQPLWGPGPGFLNPSDFEFDSQGRLLFTDLYEGAVYASTGGAPVPLCTVPPRPSAIAIDPLDRIFVWSDDGVIRIFDSSGVLVDGAFASGIGGSPGMAFGPGGVWGQDLYLVANGELWRLDSNGAVDVIGTGFSDDSFGVTDVEFGPGDALYLSEYALNRILRITPDVVDLPSDGPSSAAARLLQNEPNPFSGRTEVAFTLARSGFAEVDVYGSSGRLVRRLHAGDVGAGSHSVPWNGQDRIGRHLPSGVYFYELRLDGIPVETKKAILDR